MPQHDLNTLLIDAPVNRHFAQFHRDSEGLNGQPTVCPS